MKEINRQFGLHFDFHAGKDSLIGENTRPEDIEEYIIQTKPDFIQCDCKGHPGYSSYPTKVGTPAIIKKDNLRIWADVCKKHGIPLFVHYSGVMDCKYVADHPSQADVDENGGHYDNCTTSVFGNYCDELLIPQLKEVMTEYGIAGAWIDGEIWAVHRDYSELAQPYLWEGITPAEHGKVMRDGFYKYVKNYTDKLHEFNPDFKVISNWLYSSRVPEKPAIDVDFLSGDFQPSDSAHFVRLESRVLGVQGRKWDLMSWTFVIPSFSDKSAVQLCQEAALVLAQGGGLQLYVTQNGDGSPKKLLSDNLKNVSEFAHNRAMLYNHEPIAQIGVLLSADSFYQMNNCFNHAGSSNKPAAGALNLFVEAGYTANIVLEWQLDDIAKYDVLVVPEWEFISDENKQKIMGYAKNGGNVMVMGRECCKQFLALNGKSAEEREYKFAFIADENNSFAAVVSGNDDEKILHFTDGEDAIYASAKGYREPVSKAYKIDEIGKGKIAYIPFDLSSIYFDHRGFVYLSYIQKITDSLCKKFIRTNDFIDVITQKSENGMYLNLVNMQQGRHSLAYETFDYIPPICDVKVVIEKEYKNVVCPLGEEFSWKAENGKTVISFDKLDIHRVFLLEE